MSKTNLTIRMDEDLKKDFEVFCDEIGMNITTALTVFIKKSVREQRIPFELSNETPNKETLEALKEVQEMKKDKSIGKIYNDVDEMMKELLN